jgi:HK97 family phage portal protein
MSIFKRSAHSDIAEYGTRGRSTHSGQIITSDKAHRHSAVWASLSAISEAIVGLPVEEVVRSRTDGKTNLSFRPAPNLFFEPAPGMTWQTWIWQQVWTLAGRGRCYAMLTNFDARGWPTEMVPVPDDAVEWTYVKRTNTWVVKLGGEEVKLWPRGPLWHCPLYVMPGKPQGMSPIAHHAETIGVGLAAQEFGARFFGDGGHPTMVVQSDKDPGPKGAIALKELIMSVLSGNREPIVLPKGTTMQPWQVAPNESQFLETMRYSGEDVARIFGVPPGKIGLAISGQNVTYSNTETANADWRVSGLTRYVAPLEASLSRLIPSGQDRQIRFDFKAFMRSDMAARAAAYKIYAEIGALTGTPVMFPNEMRADEGLVPVPGGDAFVRVPPQPTPPATRSEP